MQEQGSLGQASPLGKGCNNFPTCCRIRPSLKIQKEMQRDSKQERLEKSHNTLKMCLTFVQPLFFISELR